MYPANTFSRLVLQCPPRIKSWEASTPKARTKGTTTKKLTKNNQNVFTNI
jgi:hypothetical protein